MNYGFVIDNRKCIGCHACSTACKMENEVPLGVNRTWVKSVETGVFPDVRRHFQVTRCNHCANPPCVRICPVSAMYQRSDGIVEFDGRQCIGCKACLQACPYDAIYIDPESHTAAKCHYCAHRIEIGLEPACVIVCPEHAILSGDLDDPHSEISRAVAMQRVTVRKPEQGTQPKLFYIEGNDYALTPTAVERAPATFAFADVIPLHAKPASIVNRPPATDSRRTDTQTHMQAHASPIHIAEGRMAEQMVQITWNAQHTIPWHWQVPAYLVTKGIGAGLFILVWGFLAVQLLSESETLTWHLPIVGGFVSLVATAATAALLVLDLERPERFIKIMLRPQWRSWLARGAWLLTTFSIVAGLSWLVFTAGSLGWLTGSPLEVALPLWLACLVGIPLAAGTAIYTAFLFGQAEGRDLWQSPLLPAQMLVQALIAGAGALLVIGLFAEVPSAARWITVALLAIGLFLLFAGEFGMPHATETAARAAHEIRRGRYRSHFWLGGVVLGHLIPLALLLIPWIPAGALAGACAIAGLYFYEFAFVMAPQEVPNS